MKGCNGLARYKVITPVFENPEVKRKIKDAKRKKRIFRIFTYLYAALLICTIVVTGLNASNNLIFGLGHVIMSLISFGAIAFVIYTEVKGWYKSYAYWTDYEIDPCLVERYKGKERVKEDLAEHRFVMVFLGLAYLGLAVYMLVLGIRALCGIG